MDIVFSHHIVEDLKMVSFKKTLANHNLFLMLPNSYK